MHPINLRVVTFAVILVSCVFIAPGPAAQAPSGAPRIDVARIGPQVGERVPDFAALDQQGRTQTLASIMGSGGAMLVFFRSADW